MRILWYVLTGDQVVLLKKYARYCFKQYQNSTTIYIYCLKISQIPHRDALWIQLLSETHKDHLEFEIYQKIIVQGWFISKPQVLYIRADISFYRVWCRKISFKLVIYLLWLRMWQFLFFFLYTYVIKYSAVFVGILKLNLHVVSLSFLPRFLFRYNDLASHEHLQIHHINSEIMKI